MDDSYHDEDLNREHNDVLEEIATGDPPFKVHMDTAWVYSQLAADAYRSGDLESARQLQTQAEQAYEHGMMRLEGNSGLVSEQRMQEIIFRLQHNRRLLAI